MLSALLTAITAHRITDGPVIREALRRADISLTKAAIWMEMDRALLDRRLNGDGHLRHSDLCKLPVKFWQHYLVLMIARVGVPPEYRRAFPLMLALMAQKRMARMDLALERKDVAL
jgi:hypothetical protein